MKNRFWIRLMLAGLLFSSLSNGWAQAVAVTLRLDTNMITVGGTTHVHVEARILPAFRPGSDRIFSWYVDVLNSNGTVAGANYALMQKTASDNDPLISSSGTADGANRRGVYDTFLNRPAAGRDAPVELMNIPITGLAPGQTRLRVQAGSGVPGLSADFLVAPSGGGDPLIGGDYSAAYADLQVTGGTSVTPRLSLTHSPLASGTNQVTLRYSISPGFDYFLEYRDQLQGGAPWQTFPTAPHNSGTYVDRNSVRTRFYRLRVLPATGGTSVTPRLSLTHAPLANGTNQVTLRYTITPGFDYLVEYRDQLQGGAPWLAFPSAPHNSGLFVDINAVRTRFYRLRVLPR